MKRHSFRHSKRSFGASVALGTLAGLAAILIFSVIAALILSRLKNPLAAVGMASLAVLLLSAAAASIISMKINPEGGFKFSLICAGIVCAILLAVGLIAGGGKSAVAHLMNILCYILMTLFVSFLMSRKKKHRLYR